MNTYICREEKDGFLVYDFRLNQTSMYKCQNDVFGLYGKENLQIVKNTPTPNAFNFPLKLFIDISNYCNLNCIHCLSDSSSDQHSFLEETLILKVVYECYLHGIFQIKIGGGEPLLYPSFWDMISKIRLIAPNIRLSFTTNGTILSEEDVAKIKEFSCDVSISLDGTEKVHNSIRQGNVYARVLQSIEMLVKQGIYPAVRYTLMDLNLDCIFPIYQYCLKNGLKLKIRRFKPTSYTQEHLLTYNQKYFATIEKLRELRDCDIEDIMKKDENSEKVFYRSHDCGAGFRSIYVDYNGNISPCVFLGNNYIIGNIKSNSIKELWDSAPALKTIRELKENISCRECLRKNICHGECLGIKLFYHRDMRRIDPGCCLRSMSHELDVT